MSYSPKFDYKEMSAAIVGSVRKYDTPCGKLPSITSILGTTAPAEKVASLKRWQDALGTQKAAAVSKKATDHGSNVHLLCERHLKGEDVLAPIDGKPVPHDDRNAFNAMKMKIKNIDEVWGIEVPLFSETLNVAGRCDLIGRYKGVPSIIDFKTASRVKSKDDITDYALQLAFYSIAHNEMFDTNIQQGVILMVAQTGFPMEFTFVLDEHYEELIERVEAFFRKHSL